MPRSPSTALAVAASSLPDPVQAAVARDRHTVGLRDLDIAPENLRASEPPDDDIPLLAETLIAAGQLHPLTVRPGRGKKERPYMALDGRRRLLVFARLREAGRIPRRTCPMILSLPAMSMAPCFRRRKWRTIATSATPTAPRRRRLRRCSPRPPTASPSTGPSTS